MKRSLLAVGLALSCIGMTAQAAICRWKDASGRVQYADSPPPGVTCEGQIKTPKAAPPPPAPAGKEEAKADPAGKKSYQELDVEFRKRRTDRQEAEKKAQQEREAAQQKKAACDSARSRVAGLQSGGRVAQYDATGQLNYLGEEDIKRELAEAQRAVSEACK